LSNPIKRIFDLYTSDLNYQEIEKLIKKEAGEVYEFFSQDIPKPDQSRNKFIRSLIFIRSLFNAFLMKLTPARRIVYLVSILFFVLGYTNQNNLGYVLFAFIMLNLLLAFELADKLSAKGELDVARKIQFELIPKVVDRIGKYEIAALYEPAREVGGDYFDIVQDCKKNNFIFVGDISGKGMGAALYMVKVQTIIHLLTETISDIKELNITFKKYFEKNLKREYFLTLLTARITEEGKIQLLRAGHNPAMIYKKSTNEISEITSTGIAIGFNDKGIFEKTLEVVDVELEEGDFLFLYTDGINEAMNIHRQMFGEKRIKEILKRNANKKPEELKLIMQNMLINFRGTAIQNDDQTFVIIKASGQEV
jgi:serine phosphatase RsbU (regulator of sigma subunit)